MQFVPQKKFFLFYLILEEFCDFTGTWALRYLIFLRMHFLTEILALSNFFGFQAVNWAPKWTKTVNFGAFHLSENLEFSRIFQTLCLSY